MTDKSKFSGKSAAVAAVIAVADEVAPESTGTGEILDVDDAGRVAEPAAVEPPATPLPKPFPHAGRLARATPAPAKPPEATPVAPAAPVAPAKAEAKVTVRVTESARLRYGRSIYDLKKGETRQVTPDVAAWLRKAGRAV